MSDRFHNIARRVVDELCPNEDPASKGRVMRVITKHLTSELVLMNQDIAQFHEKFGQEYNGEPRALDRELHEFRCDFMQEELDEYQYAYDTDNLEGQFDALIDLVYVALANAYLQGFPFAEGWARVHAANMAKVRATSAEQSKRGSTSDVVKRDGWQAPDLSDLVKRPSVVDKLSQS